MTPDSPLPEELLERARALDIRPAQAPERVVVALSGGVDSAVAAWLLKAQGHDVIGVTLRLAPEPDPTEPARTGRCCSIDDMTDARWLCEALDIPFHAIDARDRFEAAVLRPFVAAYEAGLTPIPCLACNHEVKFGDLYKTARQLGATLATGHYAITSTYRGHPTVRRPVDRARDQTYWLYGTDRGVMADLRLPLGELDKPLVRGLAARAGIPVATKPDSQEICFVPDGDHARVVERFSGRAVPTAGSIVDLEGNRLGEHGGVHRYTVGQRRGLNVAAGKRLYVIDVDAAEQQVTLGPKQALETRVLKTAGFNAVVPMEAWPDKVDVQVRARHRAQPATVVADDGGLVVTFDEAATAIAPGQAAVIYADDHLLGGGLIAERVDGARPRRLDLAPLVGAER
jgi:tRNA-specific 2-thiouridylase